MPGGLARRCGRQVAGMTGFWRGSGWSVRLRTRYEAWLDKPPTPVIVTLYVSAIISLLMWAVIIRLIVGHW